MISLTFLTDSAEMLALPILIRGFTSAATIEFKRLLNSTIGENVDFEFVFRDLVTEPKQNRCPTQIPTSFLFASSPLPPG